MIVEVRAGGPGPGADAALPVRRPDPGGQDTGSVDLGAIPLLPGLVDTHVHVNDPGRTDWEGFATATAAAIAGGVTTIVDMPLNSDPVTTDVAALEAKRARAAREGRIHCEYWGGLVPGNLEHLQPLAEAGVRGFKCFLVDSGIPEFPAVDAASLERAAPALAALGLPLLVHAEDPARIRPAPRPGAADLRRSYTAYLDSRPPAAEVDAIRLVARLAREHGVRVHIVHVSSAAALDAVREARQDLAGRFSAETCPHYLSLSAEDIPDGSPVFKCAPPIRSRADREALWGGLADGTLGLIASDHSPCPPELRLLDTGDLFAAWGGISSLELGISAVWTAARGRNVTLPDVARWMSAAPAELAGLDGKGRIAPGFAADLVAFDPEREWPVTEDRPTRHAPTPYMGMSMRGRVVRTWVAGRPADSVNPGANT